MVTAPQREVEYVAIPASTYRDTTSGCGSRKRPCSEALNSAIRGDTERRNRRVEDVLLP